MSRRVIHREFRKSERAFCWVARMDGGDSSISELMKLVVASSSHIPLTELVMSPLCRVMKSLIVKR